MKKSNLLSFVFLLSFFQLKAQDTLHFVNGNKLNAKTLEITKLQVKYIPADNLTGPTYSVNSCDIHKIVYQNGKTEM